jgi:hypothetical protein
VWRCPMFGAPSARRQRRAPKQTVAFVKSLVSLEGERIAMKVTAEIIFGGVVGGGLLSCNIKTEDGQRYCFQGGYAGLECPHTGAISELEGDFPGISHIEGRCAFEIAAAGVFGLPGGIQVTFFDTQDQIGTLVGVVGSALLATAVFGMGSGEWKSVTTGTVAPAS